MFYDIYMGANSYIHVYILYVVSGLLFTYMLGIIVYYSRLYSMFCVMAYFVFCCLFSFLLGCVYCVLLYFYYNYCWLICFLFYYLIFTVIVGFGLNVLVYVILDFEDYVGPGYAA